MIGRTRRIGSACVAVWTVVLGATVATAASPSEYRRAVEADWQRQEQRLRPGDRFAQSISAALAQPGVLDSLERLPGRPGSTRAAKAPARLGEAAGVVDTAATGAAMAGPAVRGAVVTGAAVTGAAAAIGSARRATLYRETRWLAREAALANPLSADNRWCL